MAWFQTLVSLAPRSRGFHLITREVEGWDDVPAHVKAALLCEHRDRGGPRRLVLTLHGEAN